MNAKIMPVSEFPAPMSQPLEYPGKRPGYSFVTDGKLVYPVDFEGDSVKSARIRTPDGAKALDSYLAAKGLAPLGERFPVMSHDSNGCPGQLRSKLGKGSVVPVFTAEITGWDAVYNLISQFGHAFAVLTPVKSTVLDVSVAMLDREQLRKINEGEEHYRLSVFPGLRLASGETISSLGYAGVSRIFSSSEFEGPIAVAEISARNRKYHALRHDDMLEHAIGQLGLDERFEILDPDNLIEAVTGPRGGFIKDYIENLVKISHSIKNKATELVEAEPDPSNPRKSLDDLLRNQA